MPSKKDGGAKQEYERHPFLLSIDEVLALFGSNIDTGLSDVKIQETRDKYGSNRLSSEGGAKWYTLLGKQISNAMILVS